MSIKEKSHAFGAGGSGMTVKEKNLSASGLNAKQKFDRYGVVPPNQAVTSKTGLSPAQKLEAFGTKAEYYGDKKVPKEPVATVGSGMTIKEKNLSVTGLNAK